MEILEKISNDPFLQSILCLGTIVFLLVMVNVVPFAPAINTQSIDTSTPEIIPNNTSTNNSDKISNYPEPVPITQSESKNDKIQYVSQKNTIIIGDTSVDEQKLTINVTDRVKWSNNRSLENELDYIELVSVNNLFNKQKINNGNSFIYQFNNTGIFTFHTIGNPENSYVIKVINPNRPVIDDPIKINIDSDGTNLNTKQIPVGTLVQWQNVGNEPVTIKATNKLPYTKTLEPGSSDIFTPEIKGIYRFQINDNSDSFLIIVN
jgi:plastocyanin